MIGGARAHGARRRARRSLEQPIVDAAVGEVLGLRARPAAEHGVDREQPHLRKLLRVALRRPSASVGRKKLRATMSWPSGVYEIVEIGLGDGARALAVDDRVDERHGRLGEHADGRADDVEGVGAHLARREQCLVLPGEQHVADAALHERVRGRARARILHGHAAVHLADEFLGFRLRRARLGPPAATASWPRSPPSARSSAKPHAAR